MRQLIDLELWWKCPELRGLDPVARSAVYYGFRREFETDPTAVAAAARLIAGLVVGILGGCLVGAAMGLFAMPRAVVASPAHSLPADVEVLTLIAPVLVGLAVGIIGGAIVVAIALRLALRPGWPWHHHGLALRPWGQRWRALVNEATARARTPQP
jgi:hypothetical protein